MEKKTEANPFAASCPGRLPLTLHIQGEYIKPPRPCASAETGTIQIPENKWKREAEWKK